MNNYQLTASGNKQPQPQPNWPAKNGGKSGGGRDNNPPKPKK